MDTRIGMPAEKEMKTIRRMEQYEWADCHLFHEGQAPMYGLVFMVPIGEQSFMSFFSRSNRSKLRRY